MRSNRRRGLSADPAGFTGCGDVDIMKPGVWSRSLTCFTRLIFRPGFAFNTFSNEAYLDGLADCVQLVSTHMVPCVCKYSGNTLTSDFGRTIKHGISHVTPLSLPCPGNTFWPLRSLSCACVMAGACNAFVIMQLCVATLLSMH